MAELSLSKNKQELIKFKIRKETVSIGRSSQNDICLPDQNISRLHMTITCKDQKFILTDKSTNGTFVNSKRVYSHELGDNDKIKIGNWNIKFSSQSEDEIGVSTQIVDRDPTRVISYKPDIREITVEKPLLRIESDKSSIFPVTKSLVSIGKSKSNDIVIDDEFVSNFHAKIENRNGEFFLKDIGSTNGISLNGQKVVESALPYNSLIEIGKTMVKFYSESEKKKISPMKDTEFHGIVSQNDEMREIFTLVTKIANSDSTVLIQGETGTGKELIARAIYKLSPRNSKPFVTVNCAAISKDLIESELFGHEKGAFTSAHQRRKGAFEHANGGTIFLDEIGELPLELQPKLLRVLENREIKRVGGNELIDIDVRILAATNRNLATEVKAGKFREDLFYRLMIIPIFVPPLRQRPEDIELLVEDFLKKDLSKGKSKVNKITPKAVTVLKKEKWGGNIRELKNVISRAVLECKGDTIEPSDLSFAPSSLIEQTEHEWNLSEFRDAKTVKTLRDVEKDKISLELKRHKWNKQETAKALGISKSTLHDKIKKYGLENPFK